ncbi:drug/metabolite transporter (DMT)-like permease [Neorhizobium huautlense]|uniref:Drug/metabolite transporter (DMT)-like permease n=1 Tax=Neorhizobium huautlense TaxID=67774 RepID=A0ABT9PRE5_9HYPH|nr:DMT family transporter [Neorhizobium huautlense]MDP9837029.1 drug/metabolite transporter (DMT)-like permease [Neorhizobium huautlense]
MIANRTGLAVAIMVLAACLNSLDAVIVRLLAGEVHPLMIGFFRSFFGLIAVTPWIIRGVNLTASPFRTLHAARAGLKLMAMVCLFVAFAHAPLADATAINFTMPIFLVLGAWLFLGEKVGRGSILGVLAGFVGVTIIIRPSGAQGFDPWLLFALAGAVLTACSQLLLRRMAQRDTTDRLVAWNLITMVPLGLVIMLPVWSMPTWTQLGLLALQGMLGAFNMTIITRAFAMANASVLAPLDFLRLPVVALMAFLVFAEIPVIQMWIGAAVIIGATVIATGGAARRKKRPVDEI